MSIKKASTGIIKKPKKVVTSQDQVMDVLRTLQQKVLASAALNGGFDTLMFKVDKIEEGQIMIVGKVDSIHEAIYNPDSGLYARIKDIEHIKEKTLIVEKLEKDVLVLQQQSSVVEKTNQKDSVIAEDQFKLVQAHAESIKDLSEFKSRICSLAKWFVLTLGGAVIGALGKLIYDLLQGHITIH